MSRATVRAALETWLAPPNVAWVGSIFGSMPKIIPGPAFTAGLGSGSRSGSVMVIFIEDEHETRTALGGPHGGRKMVTYEVGIVIRFRSSQADSQVAVDDYDALIESLKERIRADRTLGTSGTANPLFQAGEGPGADLSITSDMPRIDKGGSTYVWGALKLTVAEEIVT